MKIVVTDTTNAVGYALLQDTWSLKKGKIITHEDVVLLKQFGINKICVAQKEDNDLTAQNALTMLAAQVCGDNLAYSVNNDEVKIIASTDGILMCESQRLQKFNALNENVIINTVNVYDYVKKGEVVAKLKLLTPFLPEDKLNQIITNLSGNVSLLTVSSIAKKRLGVVLIKESNDDFEADNLSQNLNKLKINMEDFAFDYSDIYEAKYNSDSISDTLWQALWNNDLVFVFSPKACIKQDVLPTALSRVADDIVCFGVPDLQAHDLFIATQKNAKIICVPSNYNQVFSSQIDNLIKTAILKEKLYPSDFAYYRSPALIHDEYLNSQESENIIGYEQFASKRKQSKVSVVVLAAGSSSRAGQNKLMLDLDGEPLFLKSVKAAVKSLASPVFVITGNNHEEMMEYLAEYDVVVLHNHNNQEGIKSSITLGLNSVPSVMKGAILLPADMPNITEKEIDKLIKNFDESKEKQVVLFSMQGNDYNPVLWSKSLYSQAELVPENSGLRTVLMQHRDYIDRINIRKSSTLLDVNYKSDIDKLYKD